MRSREDERGRARDEVWGWSGVRGEVEELGAGGLEEDGFEGRFVDSDLGFGEETIEDGWNKGLNRIRAVYGK